MKNKIFAKLYEFCDIKTWFYKDSRYFSKFYKEYKIEFENKHFFWYYNVYNSQFNDYESRPIHSGIVTLNIFGKIISFGILFIIIFGFLKYFYNITIPSIPIIYLALIGSFCVLISFLSFSIFNWKIYMSLRKVQYFISDKKNILKKEEDEKLNTKIISIVNDTIAKNPKLARKIKLEQLNKK